MKKRLVFLATAWSGCFLTAVLGAPGGAQAADPFLETIQQEVDAVELDTRNQKSITGRSVAAPTKPRPAPGGKPPLKFDMPTEMSREDFENYLQRRYFGSYAFYRKLTSGKRERVYRAYRKNPNIELVREKIKQIYLK